MVGGKKFKQKYYCAPNSELTEETAVRILGTTTLSPELKVFTITQRVSAYENCDVKDSEKKLCFEIKGKLASAKHQLKYYEADGTYLGKTYEKNLSLHDIAFVFDEHKNVRAIIRRVSAVQLKDVAEIWIPTTLEPLAQMKVQKVLKNPYDLRVGGQYGKKYWTILNRDNKAVCFISRKGKNLAGRDKFTIRVAPFVDYVGMIMITAIIESMFKFLIAKADLAAQMFSIGAEVVA